MTKDTYESPLASRYASREMLYLFSPDKKFISQDTRHLTKGGAEFYAHKLDFNPIFPQ